MPSPRTASPHAADLLAETDLRYDRKWSLVDKVDATMFVLALIGVPVLVALNFVRVEPSVSEKKAADEWAECRTTGASRHFIFMECEGVKITRRRGET